MDLPNILNSRGTAAAQAAAAAAAAAEHQLQQQYAEAHAQGRAYSETGSERAISPHMSDQSSKYSSRSSHSLHSMSNMANGARFSDFRSGHPMLPNPHQLPMNGMQNGMQNGIQNGMQNGYPHQQHPLSQSYINRSPPQGNEQAPPQKAFACSTCSKGFARRSDLARHERIHTGVRPHVCDHPGCGKQFIQRSALTVHARVHTGEKPHMCEHCTKPFSDSSSLARHRRIHSGKRPYKCPYADCQKTFTRRTTLTRHQNHHTGTVEEAAAATAAALASRPMPSTQRTRSDGAYSDAGSARSSPAPGERHSMSPAHSMVQMPMLPRHHSDFSFMPTGGLPPHMRGDLSHHSNNSPRSSPGAASPSLSAFGTNNHQRPSLTSHPSMYGPPTPLEPPAHNEQRNSNSVTGSPQMNTMGWQSPTRMNMGSPVNTDNYLYPDAHYNMPTNMPTGHLYYPSSNIRRPQSQEPDMYENKPRLVQGEVWATQM